MKQFFIPALLILLLLAAGSCKTAKYAGLPVITDLNQLPAVPNQKAVYQTPSGKKYIINRKPAPVDEVEDTTSALPFNSKVLASAANTLEPFMLPNSNCDAIGCPDHCNFDGVRRKEAKTSISTGTHKTYTNVNKFLTTFADLHPDRDMPALVGSSNGRVPLEDFNATITTAWLFCFAKESDEDYHLVIGNKKNINDPANRFIIVEISGLPSAPGNARTVLSQAQTDFFAITEGAVCESGYFWFDDGNDPVKIKVTGSVYWDKEHWSTTNNRINAHGPTELRPRLTTVWELHPITGIQEK